MAVDFRSQVYWTERLEEQAKKYYKRGDKSMQDLYKLFRYSKSEMSDKVALFYSKYGVIKESPTFKTLGDGTKVLTGTAKKLVVPPEVAMKRLKDGTRLINLEKQLDNILVQLSKDQNDFMKVTLGDIAKDAYYESVYTVYKGVGAGASFELLNPNIISQMARNPVNGMVFSSRVWENRGKLGGMVNQTMRAGITQGISNQEMARRLSKNMDSGLYVAQRLINTEVTNAYNQATKMGYEATGLVKRYEYKATLDNRTSKICGALDSQIFNLSEAVQGLNYPPMHPNCRSTTIAYFDESARASTRIMKSKTDSHLVPADMDYTQYKGIYIDKKLSRKDWDKGKRIKDPEKEDMLREIRSRMK